MRRSAACATVALVLLGCGQRNHSETVDHRDTTRAAAPVTASTSIAHELPSATGFSPSASATPDPGWQHAAQQLEAENKQLVTERDYWKSEAGRYQEGLQRAVEELNRVAGAARAQQYQVEATAPAAEAPHVWCGTPQVVPFADEMQVNGVAYNSSGVDARGTLHVDLLENGQVLRSGDVQMSIAGRTDQAWSTSFRGTPRSGATYSARVRPEFTAQ